MWEERVEGRDEPEENREACDLRYDRNIRERQSIGRGEEEGEHTDEVMEPSVTAAKWVVDKCPILITEAIESEYSSK